MPINPYGGSYNSYYPTGVGNFTYPQQTQQPIQQPQNNSVMMFLVNNEEEARNYPLGPGGSIFLMDSSNCRFYTKSVDFSGISTFKRFEFTEVGSENSPGSDFITRDEFEKFKAQFYNRRKQNEPVK